MNVSMRRIESFTLKFYLLPAKDTNNRSKIYLRIIVDRKKAELYTGYSVLTDNWDNLREQSRSKQDSILNEDLLEIKNSLISIKRRLQYEEKPVSAKLIKDIYTGATSIRKFLLEYFQEHIIKIEKLSKEYSKGTVSNYRTTAKHLQAFLSSRKVKDIPITDVDYKFLGEFDFFPHDSF
jgi:hypothetical protein